MYPSETSATRSWRRRRQNSCHGVRAATPPSSSEDVEPAPRTRQSLSAAQAHRGEPPPG